MVKHMIIWKFKEDIEQKEKKAQEIKSALEGLVGKIDGLIKMHILVDNLPASSGDVMMDSTFKDEQSLMQYQVHSLHQEIANGLVRPAMAQRLSFDYQE